MPALPGSLALTNIPDGASIVSADHRNNYAAIQTATNALIALLSNGLLDGDPMVWDGTNTKWVAASSLAAGRPRAPRVVTSAMAGGPPASPVDQDIWIATNVDALGTRWGFQFNAGSASAFKWEFIGGGTSVNDVAAAESTASTTNADLTTGQAITLARPGDYKGEFSSIAANAAIADTYMTLVLASTEKWLSSVRITSGGITASLAGAALITGVTAGQVLKAQFRVGAGTGTWSSRHLGVVPLRIS